MLAYTYKEQGKFVLEEKEKPGILEEQDAIVRVTLASICSSDIHIKHGAVPISISGTGRYRERCRESLWAMRW